MRPLHEQGFTLIEILLVIAVISVLAAIAIPQYKGYKALGFDARAASDLRQVANAEEAYFLQYETYKDCDTESCAELLPDLHLPSIGVSLVITADEDSFTGTATHVQGSGKVYSWPS